MLALLDNGNFIQRVPEGGRFRLPNGDYVAPAVAGWTKDGYSLVNQNVPIGEPSLTLEERRAQMVLSFAQMLIGLVTEGWITQAEGEAWLDGTLPAPVSGLISQLPEEQRFAAIARAKRPSSVLRVDPMVLALGAAQGKTDAEMDTFFTTYVNV